ncbi:TPA: hypothetical protein U0910_000739 [Streptococcus suis 8830]|uniref:hypothetical protein n=1 Tax=Streptococcus suis TaxID=1307 RepID=UPI00041AE2AB|nr:hypothetical protein [Streptococcus suis]NQL78645.1 hypothetical protein [Streptococcus suis]HEM3202723.1 hypothetical protein [Streptococcus suis 8830]HEM4280783.1 hypothetical protein [Streptococcus suis]HEM5273052.1 hypothetical protein [Streptococcus suis]
MIVKSPYVENLISEVINKSEANTWQSAVSEWEIVDIEEDDCLEESCVCGKENLRYLYTIQNSFNGNILYPIGSSCIKKFEREDLNAEINVKEQMFKLLHAVEDNAFLELSSEFFSRKLLLYLYEQGAFKATNYNHFNSHEDYQFMLDMFNKRNVSEKQSKKAVAIILNSIKPFVQEQLKDKVRTR